mgnify:CR=1 FL=1
MFEVDKKMEMFCENERWEKEIEKLISKGVKPLELSQFTTGTFRTRLAYDMLNGNYRVTPPHVALIPKDKPGEFRKVYVNTVLDRLMLGLINSVYYDLYTEEIHPRCVSYRKGVGVNKIIKDVCHAITQNQYTGYKVDLSKYFDSVNQTTLDKVLKKFSSNSCIDKIVWDYYHDNLIMNENDELEEKYKSLAQGCAVAAFLANVTLRDVDEAMSTMVPVYYRYSDDILIIGPEADKALDTLKIMLVEKGLSLNPRKIEKLSADKWFTFLGSKIRGNTVSLSKQSLKEFCKKIKKETVQKSLKPVSEAELRKMIKNINKYLYFNHLQNDKVFGWSQYFFGIMNSEEDIQAIDMWVKDLLRSMLTGKHRIGGIGSIDNQRTYAVVRGKGRNVRANLEKVDGEKLRNLGYVSMMHMYRCYHTSKELFNSQVWLMK